MNKEISKLTRDFEGLYSGDNWVAVGIEDILNTTDFDAAIKRNYPTGTAFLQLSNTA